MDTKRTCVRSASAKAHLTRLDSDECTQLFVVCRPDPGEDLLSELGSLYRGLFERLAAEGAHPREVVMEKLFFRDVAAGAVALAALRGSAGLPWAEYAPASIAVQEPPSFGVRCWAELQVVVPAPALGARFWSFGADGDGPKGRALALGDTQWLWLGGVLGGPGQRAHDDAYAMFEAARQLLAAQGVSFSSVVRTWIYLREMERDYAALNRARRAFFLANGVERRPASTGIGGAPSASANRMALCLHAVTGAVQARTMHTPTLNEASEYGSDFSRGMSVEAAGCRTLYISGTASVDEAGRSFAVGDLDAQVERMIHNVETLLEHEGASLADIASAITYLKDADDLPRLLASPARRRLPDHPHSVVQAEVCRPELLCEMEVIAVVPAR